jgi:hypothetical protein
MVRHKQHEQWQRIRALIGQYPEGIGLQAIIDTLNHGFEAGSDSEAPPRRT